MAKARVAILKAPGTNCDAETAFAFDQAGGQAELVWVEELKENRKKLSDYQILAIPGGFTYGDDLGAGRLLANELQMRLNEALQTFLEKERLVIGICNGFQMLIKSGILPSGRLGANPAATLTTNDSGKFEDRWVHLRSEFNVCIWTQGMEDLFELPVAHGEGKFLPKDKTALEELMGLGQIVLHYSDPAGAEAGYPFNPNGSVGSIAGICDPTGRIFGLMPHPERHLWSHQHPRARSESREGLGAGGTIFKNGIRWAEKHAS